MRGFALAVLIAVMVVIFDAALLLPFSRGHVRDGEPTDDHHRGGRRG
jgi:hypothetical protein